ncbi:unnamed protein product [Rotaria sordida]|uniref:Uncharacterized protein n=1 Tax=Rotaria sordida TaxID=392033 RepID=A0A814X3T8_9BILA|nr:unnamed protein product [Rotaria sordida]CAF1179497.1 unnamed protein product [Rotaria sordida]CAF1213999.1 unnamed protein product [Rotaria sordida]CAF3775629.1 unnamed protein product [Rotaria sordida]
MTISNEELLISRPPQYQQRKYPTNSTQPQSIQIECQAEERHFINDSPTKISGSLKPIHFTMNKQIKPGKYRSEIVVHNNPNVDLYIKRLHVAFDAYDDLSMYNSKHERPSSRSHTIYDSSKQKHHQQQGKYRSYSLPPRSNTKALLHQWIDDICSNEKLMADDDICFFLKNGEFLARI